MLKILLPVDGSENSDRAVRHLIGMAGHCGAMDIRVMNVQPPFLYIEVLLKPRQEVIDAWARKAGKDAARSACALLDAADIPYTLELLEGEVAETLVQYAGREQCDMIVMGTRGMGTVANLVLGSVATKVIHLSHIPVTLVK
ncbi:MAG: universal stress protein [Burkholderiales bacterium]